MKITVSILVLMDLSLQPVALNKDEAKKQCFNPCFNGSFTSTGRGNLPSNF